MSKIRIGSEIVLRHVATNKFLNAPGVAYTHDRSSRQDMVTCREIPSEKSFWIVKPPYGYPDDYLFGEPIKNGMIIRLENRSCKKHLHSHRAPAPITGTPPHGSQMEVTCFSTPDWLGNIDDNWRIEGQAVGDSDIEIFRLIHTTTNGALHSHDNKHPTFTAGEQEVTSYPKRDNNDFWQVVGIYGPLSPVNFVADRKASGWMSIINLIGSIASVTGITLLFLGATLKTATFAKVLSVGLATCLCLGLVLGGILVLLGMHRRMRLKFRTLPPTIVMWMISSPIVLVCSCYLWYILIQIASPQFETFLSTLFGIKK